MSLPEIQNSSPVILLRQSMVPNPYYKATNSTPSASKSRTPKPTVAYKNNNTFYSNTDLKTPIKSKKAMINIFLEDLLRDIIANREHTACKDLTSDSDDSFIADDDIFTPTAHLELEGESKRSLLSSSKGSKLSGIGSEKNSDKIIQRKYHLCFILFFYPRIGSYKHPKQCKVSNLTYSIVTIGTIYSKNCMFTNTSYYSMEISLILTQLYNPRL